MVKWLLTFMIISFYLSRAETGKESGFCWHETEKSGIWMAETQIVSIYICTKHMDAARATKILPVADAMFWSSAMSPNINGVWVGTWLMTGCGRQVGFKFKRNLSMWEFFIKTVLEMIFWNSIFLLQNLHLNFLELFNGSKTRPLSDPTTYKRKGQSIFEYANWPRLQI